MTELSMTDAAVRSRAARSRKRVLECQGSFDLFCKTYLPEHFTKKFGAAQQDLIQRLLSLRGGNARIVQAQPRSWGKSSILMAYCLWCMLYKLKRFLLYVGDSRQQAANILDDIRNQFENNPMLQEDFGDLVTRHRWGKYDIETATGVRLMAVGAKSRLRGFRHRETRPDLIILDDLENDTNALTAQLRDRLHGWVRKVVLNMPAENGDVIYVGTIIHFDSVLQRILNDEAWISSKWAALDADGNSTWPEAKSNAWCDWKKKEVGLEAWNSEFMNNPSDPESQPFKSEFLTYYEDKDLFLPTGEPRYLVNYLTLDPARSDKEKSHNNAIIVVGVDEENIWWVRDIWVEKCGEARMIEMFFAKCIQWGVVKAGIETAFMQIGYRKQIQEEMLKRNQWFPLHDLDAHAGKKEVRIRLIEPRWSIRTIKLPKKHPKVHLLVDEIIQFPKGRTNDMLDALAYQIQIAEPAPKPDENDLEYASQVVTERDPDTGYEVSRELSFREMLVHARGGPDWLN